MAGCVDGQHASVLPSSPHSGRRSDPCGRRLRQSHDRCGSAGEGEHDSCWALGVRAWWLPSREASQYRDGALDLLANCGVLLEDTALQYRGGDYAFFRAPFQSVV